MLPLSGPNLKHICLTCPLFVGPKTFWHILCLEFSSVVYQSNALALKEESFSPRLAALAPRAVGVQCHGVYL